MSIRRVYNFTIYNMYLFHISTENNLSSEYIITYFKNQFNAEKSGILLSVE